MKEWLRHKLSWTSWSVLNAEKKIGPFLGSSIRPNLVLTRPCTAEKPRKHLDIFCAKITGTKSSRVELPNLWRYLKSWLGHYNYRRMFSTAVLILTSLKVNSEIRHKWWTSLPSFVKIWLVLYFMNYVSKTITVTTISHNRSTSWQK